jgi:dolichyl-diphosphooligosaccharide--protein glycosyltransferase
VSFVCFGLLLFFCELIRVLDRWDYGYQITGVGSRTTIADGNTWNHEHIALLGRTLVLPEEESYTIARHIADYVLVVTSRHAGIYGDDLAKSPHMARIAGSVYPDINATGFTMERDGTEMGSPSAMMKESMLYKLHSWGLSDDVPDLKHYEEACVARHSSRSCLTRLAPRGL